MTKELELEILPQPDDTTCGPTCLHAVYRYFEDHLPLQEVIAETPKLQEGGTLAVCLGSHALRRGYRATIYTFNLKVFDPTWFPSPEGGNPRARQRSRGELIELLAAQSGVKTSSKLKTASASYTEFLQLGGVIRMEDLNAELLRRYLLQSVPVLTGLSATYLYHCERELPDNFEPDDVRGVPCGHFVVLSGYDKDAQTVQIADPYLPNPLGEKHHYDVSLDRLICAILLGVLTYDANLLIIEPGSQSRDSRTTLAARKPPGTH